MGYLKYVKELWQKPKEKNREGYRELLLKARREPVTVRLERPTNIPRARSLGYKPKQGVVVVRQCVSRGGRMRPDIKGGRRSAHSGQSKIVKKNYKQVAEERAQVKYKNCEVLGSYKILEDGKHAWYEIILVDRLAPTVLADKKMSQAAKMKGRAQRGLTSAGLKSRGMRNKGKGSEKIRPSLRANKRTH
jgi:large subunit ribosomal protein L15e